MAKTICLLALSDIANDPRVRRQGDALYAAGWTVIGLGIPGSASDCPAWPVVTESRDQNSLGDSSPSPGVPDVGPTRFLALRRRLRQSPVFQRLWRFYLSIRVRLRPAYALQVYWSHPDRKRMYSAGAELKADVWLANDWIMLPLAARLAKEKGGVYAYDAHEFAVDEYAERRAWRLMERPFVRAIEGQYIGGAARVSTVSPGIAEGLRTRYALKQAPLVIRNTPTFHPVSFRPTGMVVRVLYHGIVVPNRGLEAAIESVPAWRPEFTLTIRGPGNPEYLSSLRERIAALRLEARVTLAPPVAMTELVRAATAFDVGLFSLPGHSLHNMHALANKFFEYVMAGLALCVTDLPEMASLVARYRLGVLIARAQPASIAAAINQLDRDAINEYKQNALTAARELSWDRESQRMVQAYEELLPTGGPA